MGRARNGSSETSMVITFYPDDDTKAMSAGKTGFVYVIERSDFDPVDPHVMPGE
jgi:hypothetical protein